MTWRCAECRKLNLFWKNKCERCGKPVRGYDREVTPVEPSYVPLTGPVVITQPQMFVDCGCPKDNYVCGSTGCPRQMRVTIS